MEYRKYNSSIITLVESSKNTQPGISKSFFYPLCFFLIELIFIHVFMQAGNEILDPL